jgi:hypothetical protein
MAAAVVGCAREDRVVVRIALAYGVLQLAVIGWDLPSAIGWENDGVAPKDFLRGVFHNLAWGQAHRYPLFHNLLLLLACAPVLLLGVVAGPWSTDAIAGRVSSVACMTAVSLVIKLAHVAMGVGALVLVARVTRRLFGVSAGRFAALCAASSLTISYYGRASNLDGPYMFWTVLALDCALDVLERGARRDYALLGLCMAASVATKDQAYASYALALPIYLGLTPLLSPHELPAGPAHWRRLGHGLQWAALGYAVLAGVLVNPAGFVARLRMLAGTNSQDWRSYARSAEGLRLNLEDLWAAQAQFFWHWGVVALCWGGVLYALLARPEPGSRRRSRLLPIAMGLSSVLAFTLPVARCEHRFMLPLGVMLCVYGGAALAGLFRQRFTWPLACAACVALCLSAWQCTLLALTQWGDARNEVERYLARLPHGSLVEAYGFVVFQPRFDTSAGSPYGVDRVGNDAVRARAHIAGTTEVRDAFSNVGERHPDVIVVSDGFAERFLERSFRKGEVPSVQWLAAKRDADAVAFFRAVARGTLPGYHTELVARSRLPAWAQALGGKPVRIHDSTDATIFVLRRDIRDASLSPQRFDRIEIRRALCGQVTKERADCDAEEQRADRHVRTHRLWPVHLLCHQHRGRDANRNPGAATEPCEHQRLGQELLHDLRGRSADRRANPDLVRALGHGHELDVHDADAADQQRHRSDHRQQAGERAADLLGHACDVVGAEHAKVGVLVGLHLVGSPEDRLDLAFGRLEQRAALGSDLDHPVAARNAEVGLEGAERQHHTIVHVAAGDVRAVGDQHADHAARQLAVDREHLTERVCAAKERSSRGSADHANLPALRDIRGVEHPALSQLPVFRIDDFGHGAEHAGADLLAVHGHIQRLEGVGDDIGQRRRLALQRSDIFGAERSLSARPHAVLGLDPQQVAAQGLELRDDRAARAAPEAHHRDEGADADRQPERGERAATRIAHRHLQRDRKRASSPRHARPSRWKLDSERSWVYKG